MQKVLINTLTALALINTALLPIGAEAGGVPNETSGAVINQQTQNKQRPQGESPAQKVIIRTEQQPAAGVEQGEKLTLRQVKFMGDNLEPEPELQKLARSYLGKEIGIADLKELCGRISQYLQSKDYAVAKAYLPKQDIVDGVVTIAVVGGRYGDIHIKNNTSLKEAVIHRETTCLKSGDYIRTSSLERAILLLNDLSGVNAKAYLSAGSKLGTSDLNIDINPANENVKWQLNYDNFGSYNVGPNEIGLTANWNNPSRQGDHLYLRLNTGAVSGVGADNSKGLLLGAFNWQAPIGSDGGKISVGYSKLNYVLGRSFAGSGFAGTAKTMNLNWTKPLLRSRLNNLTLAAGFDNARLSNDYPSLSGAEQTINRLNLGLAGYNIDANGMNNFIVTWTSGHAKLDSNAERIDNGAKSAGHYNKISYNLTRQQSLTDRLALEMKLNGQFADKNLVSYEKLSLGGPYGVRAYGVGEASGDDGWLGTAELHWLLPKTENVQLVAFGDIGKVTINHNPWSAVAGENTTTLAGYGLGLNWDRPGISSVNLSYAWRAGNALSTIGDSPRTNGRLWLNIVIDL